jgi:hypothetical protein
VYWRTLTRIRALAAWLESARAAPVEIEVTSP